MRATRSRTITSLLAAVGAGFAVSAMIGAPAAVAQPGDTACAPGQVVIDGQCNVPDNATTSLRLQMAAAGLGWAAAALGWAAVTLGWAAAAGGWRSRALTPLNRHVQNPGPSGIFLGYRSASGTRRWSWHSHCLPPLPKDRSSG